MHFDAARLGVEARFVSEVRQYEVATEFPVDASQQVQIEGGRNAQAVVIGVEHLRDWFDEVGAEQERVTGLQNAA